MTHPGPVVVMPVMSAEQAASWHGLMDLHGRVPTGWTLVGGQLVHLHCAERGEHPERPTDDIDTIVDVRTSLGGTSVMRRSATRTDVLAMEPAHAVESLDRLERAAGLA